MQLNSPSPSTRYTPHPFAPSAYVVGDNYSTIKITEYTFTFINKDYPIPSGYKIQIILPTGMKYSRNPARVTVISGLFTPLQISGSTTDLIIDGDVMGELLRGQIFNL